MTPSQMDQWEQPAPPDRTFGQLHHIRLACNHPVLNGIMNWKTCLPKARRCDLRGTITVAALNNVTITCNEAKAADMGKGTPAAKYRRLFIGHARRAEVSMPTHPFVARDVERMVCKILY
jgi:hypothetical protein